jgi:hypothetical protein
MRKRGDRGDLSSTEIKISARDGLLVTSTGPNIFRGHRHELSCLHLETKVGTIVPGFGRPGDADLPSIVCSLSDDLLWGAGPIAGFVSQIRGQVVHPKRISAWADQGLLPVGHWGGRLVGSKKAIAAHFAAIASEPSAASTKRPKSTERYSRNPLSVRSSRRGQRVAMHQVKQARPQIVGPVVVTSDQVTAGAATDPGAHSPGRDEG